LESCKYDPKAPPDGDGIRVKESPADLLLLFFFCSLSSMLAIAGVVQLLLGAPGLLLLVCVLFAGSSSIDSRQDAGSEERRYKRCRPPVTAR
jgi:hypothetical protein